MKLFLLLLLVLIVAILASCSSPSQRAIEGDSDTYPTHYTNGQILLPDYAHNDTLVVINANRLNSLFSGPPVQGDEDISDILYEGAVPINKHQNK
jgi:hypothetical protein